MAGATVQEPPRVEGQPGPEESNGFKDDDMNLEISEQSEERQNEEGPKREAKEKSSIREYNTNEDYGKNNHGWFLVQCLVVVVAVLKMMTN